MLLLCVVVGDFFVLFFFSFTGSPLLETREVHLQIKQDVFKDYQNGWKGWVWGVDSLIQLVLSFGLARVGKAKQ